MGHSDLAICFTNNKNYLPLFHLACHSFLDHNPGSWNVFMISDDIDEVLYEKVTNGLKKRFPKSTFHLIQVTPKKVEHLPLPNHEKIGHIGYYRLLLPDLLPLEYTRALYLDADLIVNDKLEFLDSDMINTPIAGVYDPMDKSASTRRKLDHYFNAGVLLMNLDIWRSKKHVTGILNHKPDVHVFGDQDYLNSYFKGQWKALESKYNYPNFNLLNGKTKDGKHPKIIHYMGTWKPWKYWYRGSSLYWKYILKSPYYLTVLKVPITMINSVLNKLQLIS